MSDELKRSEQMGIEKMISVAVEYGLVGDYRLSPTQIELDVGGAVCNLDPEEARFFLLGLLKGYRQVANKGSVAA